MPRWRYSAAYVVLVLAGTTLPLVTQDTYYLDVATNLLIGLMLATSLQLQMSTGQVNMAHISFMGIGAYASALLVTKAGLTFWVSLWIAGAVAAAIAVPVGFLALRLVGPYYFLITFAFSEVVRLVFNNFFVDVFGGTSGLVGIPKPQSLQGFGFELAFEGKLQIYILALLLFLMMAPIPLCLESSRFGLISNAIRQHDRLAEALGTDVLRHRLAAFLLGSFMAGLAGAFYAHSHGVLHSSDFSLEPMVLLVVFVVIGGARSVAGAVVGALALTVLSEQMRELHQFQTLAFGALLMVTMLLAPGGLISIPETVARFRRRRGSRTDASAAERGRIAA